MNTYIVAYDLRKQRDYTALIDAIKKYPIWAKILESNWAVVTSQSAEEVRNNLQEFMDGDDGIFVIKSGTESAWAQVLCNGQWLKDNL